MSLLYYILPSTPYVLAVEGVGEEKSGDSCSVSFAMSVVYMRAFRNQIGLLYALDMVLTPLSVGIYSGGEMVQALALGDAWERAQWAGSSDGGDT